MLPLLLLLLLLVSTATTTTTIATTTTTTSSTTVTTTTTTATTIVAATATTTLLLIFQPLLLQPQMQPQMLRSFILPRLPFLSYSCYRDHNEHVIILFMCVLFLLPALPRQGGSRSLARGDEGRPSNGARRRKGLKGGVGGGESQRGERLGGRSGGGGWTPTV